MIKNINHLKRGGLKIFIKKFITLFLIFLQIPLYFIYLPILILIYTISPIFLIRFSPLKSSRIGRFAATTELYCCEKDERINQTKKNYLDIFFLHRGSISNKQLAKMWKRNLNIFPEFLISPIYFLNKFISTFFKTFKKHDISENSSALRNEHDTNNLLEKYPPHLKFTEEEEKKGRKYLEEIGLKKSDKFVCIISRDEKYLESFDHNNYSYHDFRNISIDKFLLTAEEISKRGYFVFRMGKKVKHAFKSENPKIIDYANSKNRSDFLDIYLGAKCLFCLSSHTGFDNIPVIFRKPIVYISVPIAFFFTHCKNSIVITRHHYSSKKKRNLNLSEIANSEIARTQNSNTFEKLGVKIKEPSPEDINDASIEMMDRLEGKWQDEHEDTELQKKFWNIYGSSPYTKEFTKEQRPNKFDRKLHGDIKIKFGSKFLRNNRKWLN